VFYKDTGSHNFTLFPLLKFMVANTSLMEVAQILLEQAFFYSSVNDSRGHLQREQLKERVAVVAWPTVYSSYK